MPPELKFTLPDFTYEAEVRYAHPDPQDAYAIQLVYYLAWLVTYPNVQFGITIEDIETRFAERFTDLYLREFANKLANPKEGEHRIVAKEDGVVEAYCSVKIEPSSNHIGALYVLPRSWRSGYGTQMLSIAKQFSNPLLPTELWVAPYNARAIRFYEKRGFKMSGKIDLTNPHLKMPSGKFIPTHQMIRPPSPASL